jgi:hypothetical protein
MARLFRIGETMQLSQPVREHKNTSQQQKIQHQIERTLEEQASRQAQSCSSGKIRTELFWQQNSQRPSAALFEFNTLRKLKFLQSIVSVPTSCSRE